MIRYARTEGAAQDMRMPNLLVSRELGADSGASVAQTPYFALVA